MDRYKKIGRIGRGTFGDVLLVESCEDGRRLAIKRVITEKEDKAQESINEIAVLSSLDHPNIVKYYESFRYKDRHCIVMDYAGNGDLQSRVKKAKEDGVALPSELVLSWFSQLCLALKHIHARKVLHRDLKTQNVFLSADDRVKLGDFGISKVLERVGDFATTPLGTPYYLSPEICSGFKYDYKSDLWMLGCILYELCALKRPFEGESLHVVISSIMTRPYLPLPKET